ncbi:MAG TPA: LacI family DNA-binding transcriptional regulator [Chitinophaga sp.]|uniref:LacI family DNA-binding transcriptional regulator n=1 Tax=Chitinophaga sp. TaxID=1869181 RepID=UPI002C0E642E|nr:LacI family DNA-binding transcriptional regulator [Chitinophaga sp.]HVI46872.1 LacI family DNA-binding transcriptional regulator [Chitinophaga sp.]
MKKVNIKALAKELNLSPATVSKALRDSHEISAATKQRVLEVAKQLNYAPNAYASSLRDRRSRNIAVIIPEVADSFFSIAINGIEAAIEEKDYHVLIYLTHELYAREQAILKDFKSGRVDGVLISVSRETTDGSHISELIAEDVPVVFFDRVLENVEAPKVVTDDFNSGYTGAMHLLDNGCRHIAFLGISNSLSISNNRMAGYQQALKDHHLTVSPDDMITCTPDTAANFTAIKQLLAKENRPDGIVASVENLTNTVYQVCNELQLSIPQDIKVVCFSNLDIAAILHPPLTTITQPAFQIGKAAAELLLKSLGKKDAPSPATQIVIPSELIIRGSSKRS